MELQGYECREGERKVSSLTFFFTGNRTRSIKLSFRQWEDKLRSECSRLKAELDELHAEEKHLAVESMKVQKEQEIRKLKQSWELRQEEMTKEVS